MSNQTVAHRANASPALPAFENTYAEMPERFYAPTDASPVSTPQLIRLNEALAAELGIEPDFLRNDDGIAMLAGNRFPQASKPIAQAYAGHQFGNFAPQLGDGRALLIGELIDRNGQRRDIQLKGSGPTRFSRNGDGRAALGPVLREYIVGEAMAALDIPTTRALAAVLTGEKVYRETRLPGAVFARVAASHIRVGTFQYFAARGDVEGLRTLADYAINRHYPEARKADQPYVAFLRGVVARQAELIAKWLLVGFIHGVMNTDNMTISGETIDYGPCAFMEAYNPATVLSSIDQGGRYAYANQPGIAVWNLARLAEALLPILHEDINEAVKLGEAAIQTFQSRYEAAFHSGLRRKIGLSTAEDGDIPLLTDLFERMERNRADFTLTFRQLCHDTDATDRTRALFANPADLDDWAIRWRERLVREPGGPDSAAELMLATNPKYIPRNHRIEEAIQAAVERSDFQPFERLLGVVSKPFDEQPENEAYAAPARNDERVLRTFCGT